MADRQTRGVVFPLEGERRATTATGRAIVSAALGAVDPVGARAAAGEADWRHGYPVHFRRLVEAGLGSPEDAVAIARTGLRVVHDKLLWCRADGMDVPLADAATDAERDLGTETVVGLQPAQRVLTVPYRGQQLTGAALIAQAHRWVERGVVELSCATALSAVVANPDWLDLRDLHVVVLGAGAEMGPLLPLLGWGAEVYAVDVARPDLWRRVLGQARNLAGTVHLPATEGDGSVESRAGVDLITEWPCAVRWLLTQQGSLGQGARLVLGNYVYADGADNVRVATAVDLLSQAVRAALPDTALAFLATPTDVFAVPGSAVEAASAAYQNARLSKAMRPPLRLVSRGRLLTRNYVPGSDPGINDSIVAQQGPNYLLAKRIQRWRATVARAEGVSVSLAVAPPTRTQSVIKNRALAAAYAGSHRFGIEVFEPETARTLMAALLVHDLRTAAPALGHPWREEAHQAVHGGLWRAAYSPRSALGLAALLGMIPHR